MNLYVGNLSFDTSESDLRSHFVAIGHVQSVKIIQDRETGKSRGFAFVEMSNDDEGRAALQQLDGVALQGRDLKISEARDKK